MQRGVAKNLTFFQEIKEAQLDTSKTAIMMIQKLEKSGKLFVEADAKDPSGMFEEVNKNFLLKIETYLKLPSLL